MKKQRSFASRSSSSSRPGLEQTVSQVDPPGSTSADGHDDDVASVLSRSSSGGERVCGNSQFPCSRRSHGTPGPKSPARRPTQRSIPARSQAGDLAGDYGVQAVSQVDPPGSTSADGPNPPPPGDSTLGTLSQVRSPRSESKRPVERPSFCDTVHNARLAMKGSVQQSPVNRPVYSEHVPVTQGPGKPGTGPMTSTRYRDPVPGARFYRPHRVNRVHRPHQVHRSHRVHQVHRSHRVHWSDQSTLVRKFNRKRPTSACTGLSFLFLFHRSDWCN